MSVGQQHDFVLIGMITLIIVRNLISLLIKLSTIILVRKLMKIEMI